MAAHDDVRAQANDALKERPIDSVKTAFKFSAGVVAVLAAIGTGLARLNKFDLAVLWLLVAVGVASWFIAFVALELVRLWNHSKMLQQVLLSERNVDALIEATRAERNEIQQRLIAAETRVHAQTAIREVVEIVRASTSRRGRQGGRQQTELREDE